MDAITKATVAMACFTGVLVLVNIFYWVQTRKLWKVTNNSLVVDLFMRMIKFEPKSDAPGAWNRWAFMVNVAMGKCLDKELGGKLAEIIRTVQTMAEPGAKMDDKTKKEKERLNRILTGQNCGVTK